MMRKAIGLPMAYEKKKAMYERWSVTEPSGSNCSCSANASVTNETATTAFSGPVIRASSSSHGTRNSQRKSPRSSGSNARSSGVRNGSTSRW